MGCYSNAQGSFIYDVHRYARIEPQVLQVELHPYLTQEPLVKYCKLLGLAITAYSSFGPQSYVELGYQGAVSLLEHDTVSAIASKTQKSQCFLYTIYGQSTCLLVHDYAAPAQVLLRWALQQGLAVIPKSNNHDRLVQNLACVDFELSEDDMKSISGLNKNLRVSRLRWSPNDPWLTCRFAQLNDPADLDPRLAIFA